MKRHTSRYGFQIFLAREALVKFDTLVIKNKFSSMKIKFNRIFREVETSYPLF